MCFESGILAPIDGNMEYYIINRVLCHLHVYSNYIINMLLMCMAIYDDGRTLFWRQWFSCGNSWYRERRSPLCPGRDGSISKRNTEGYAPFKTHHNPKDLPSISLQVIGSWPTCYINCIIAYIWHWSCQKSKDWSNTTHPRYKPQAPCKMNF